MRMDNLEQLLITELKDLYDAEKQILKALPKLADAASSAELQRGFKKHLEQTKGHVERLDQIFEHLGQTPGRKKCKGMEGLIEEGNHLLEEDVDPEVLDAALIAAAQKVEHYEIASYGCVRTYAELLGNQDAAKLLQKTLDEEKETDSKLSELANQINLEASEDESDDESRTPRKPSPTSRPRTQAKQE